MCVYVYDYNLTCPSLNFESPTVLYFWYSTREPGRVSRSSLCTSFTLFILLPHSDHVSRTANGGSSFVFADDKGCSPFHPTETLDFDDNVTWTFSDMGLVWTAVKSIHLLCIPKKAFFEDGLLYPIFFFFFIFAFHFYRS